MYIHIPYCLEKCPYCDFHSVAVERGAIPERRYALRLVEQLEADVARLGIKGRPLLSVFFGGGTPSLMSPPFFETVLKAVAGQWGLSGSVEITVETNPATAWQADFRAWKSLGINRISFGAQSFQPGLLQKLGRRHSPEEAVAAVRAAQEAGFDNISCDLIFGVEGETQTDLARDLRQAMLLGIPHLSAYQLTVESGTPLALWVKEGRFQIPEEEMLAAMHSQVSETLERGGWRRYEISNYAKPGFESRHNLQYWRYGDFLGVGSGAVAFVNGQRWRTTRKLRNYLEQNAPREEEETIDPKTARKERWMMGLRLEEGVAITPEEVLRWGPHLAQWSKEGWIRPFKDRIQLTPKGFLFCNRMVQNVFDLVDEVC